MKFSTPSASSFGLAVLSLLGSAVGSPVSGDLSASSNVKTFTSRQNGQLRVMPLGASITAGDYSLNESKNGYRKFLRDDLVSLGWDVDMVGNFNSGTMEDNDHEGVSGERVDEVAARAGPSAQTWRPNVVLINAGTNDAGQDYDVDTTGERMRELINSVINEVSDAVIVLSTLLPTGDSDTQSRVDGINEQYRDVQSSFVSQEPQVKVVLADMAMSIMPDRIHDGTHPDIEGERMMADLWIRAIEDASQRGWISE